uniref:Uncharacterized protein n=1 Tax=Arundo donax TaxID=35708 RepID=A0A0A9HNV6_ARUDO
MRSWSIVFQNSSGYLSDMVMELLRKRRPSQLRLCCLITWLPDFSDLWNLVNV